MQSGTDHSRASGGGLPSEIEEQVRQEGCGLSSSHSTQCRTVNGETKCQEEVSYFKRCPGKKPELVYRNKTETEGAPQAEMESVFPSFPSSIFGGGPQRQGRDDDDFFGPFSDFFKSFEKAFSGRDTEEGGKRGFPFPGRSHRTLPEGSGQIPPNSQGSNPVAPPDANTEYGSPAPWVNDADPHRRIDEARRQASKNGGTYV